ncbi:MAG TPA: carboxypeptidase regulatory-like domain-containing protein [Candidatus Limnocylindrales bacterium]|nr:carboxypeptidase regulatory-like domain-containing protein [Candidatus Limnocylindrales bacterium]
MFISKRHFVTTLAVALLLALTLPAIGMAQDQGSARGNLSGIVYDPTRAVVPGAEVTITGPIGSKSQTTNEGGAFLFQALIPGLYSVRVQKTGFRVSEIKNSEVLINKTTSLEVVLQTGELTQVVEVSAASLTLDTTSSAVNTNISESMYQNLPVGRNMGSLFYLSPGSVDGQGTGYNNPSISGSTGLENAYVADGVNINDPAFGGLGVFSRVHGALGSGINLSFVQEVQVKTGGFEPQYGHAAGGVVQIVTKSGGTQMHGTAGGYYAGKWMQTQFANADDFGLVNQFGKWLTVGRYEGDFELGGYVPLGKLKEKLFYFGTFNPTWVNNYDSPGTNSGLFTLTDGKALLKQTSWDYAGKLTYKINSVQTLESSVFGDPSHTNAGPWTTLTAANLTTNSKWNYGTRNWAVRYDGTFGGSWLIDAAFTWSWNHFTETPQSDVVQIVDQTQTQGLPGQTGQFTAQGFGFNEPYDSNTRSIAGDTSKTVHLFGQAHTFSFGYNWQFPVYDDIIKESGGYFTIPSANASGSDPGYLNNSAQPAGKQTDAALTLILAGTVAPGTDGKFDPVSNPTDTSCTLCPYMSVPGYSVPVPVVLQQVRGRFDGGVTRSSGKYHAAYVNDAWSIGRHVTLNAGVRWEQQRLIGNITNKLFNDMWSPRAGVTVDPKGDRKTKIYGNFGRYHFILPLDAAVRELSNEEDFLNPFWAPASTTSGCPAGTPSGASCVVTNSDGTPNYANMFTPDAAHLLSLATGGVDKAPTIAINGGEPYQPGLRAEYTDEFVVGAEHQFKGGIVASVRYIDRRLKRVVEDEGGISVEQFIALANNGGGLNYFIGNPNSKSDIFVNPNEVTFGVGQTLDPATTPLPAACYDANGNPTPYVAWNVLLPTFPQTSAGSACFPAVNTNTWTDSSGNLLPDCTSLAQSKQAGACAAFGGEFYPDGKPDTYKDPIRIYKALEFEVNKSFSHNWALIANWRWAKLSGNYEGAFRNDNGQADPGISSLFDLTEGAFGLLGAQQGIGPLNTDRRHVVNVYATYVLDRTKMKGLTLGSGVRIQTGVPLTTLYAQYAYQNPGEVPLFGRGDLGRAPTTGTVDAHAEYPWKLTEKLSLKFGFDAFNIANSKRTTLIDEFGDLGFGVQNLDFKKPGGMLTFTPGPVQGHAFVNPFNSRFSLKLVF